MLLHQLFSPAFPATVRTVVSCNRNFATTLSNKKEILHVKGSVKGISPLRCFLMVGAITLLSSCSYNECVTDDCQQDMQEPQDKVIKIMEDNTTKNDLTVAGKPSDGADALEPASDMSYSDGLISARVMSTGCTMDKDFHIEHIVKDNICQITIVRDRQDMCRKVPESIEVSIAWEKPLECNEADLEFMNPALKVKNSDVRVVMPKKPTQ
ncbi:hypothetical protein [Granulosicoccus antarcticus]|uniref:Uncharacterized protein n=1 Tax=Granulosicoccus antarcticus IMCC3135 TaxID=1192854 RepID=A0A2Z2P1U6_9GAMM|nr:hypothetical protein [Granulosicoccus antarcticus]ASJ76531.1 hypothetical protein IMCC3135_32430 [Granulosicoccus antarcticus IMCC3135]